jgi:Response regulator containing a CheY-like receiver domain and an HTH DNA-binding domain
MTPSDGSPAVEWFSQADVLAYMKPRHNAAITQATTKNRTPDHFVFTDSTKAAGKFDPSLTDFSEYRTQLRQAGFSTLSYGAFEMIGSRMLYAHLLRDLAPVSFAQPYFKGMWYEVDPRFAEVQQSGFPVAWRLEQIDEDAQRSGDRRKLALVAALRAHAMNSGVIFSLSAPQLGLNVSVGLTSELHDSDWINDRVIGTALAVSLAVHRFAQPFLEERIRSTHVIALEPEQEAVLLRLVQGLSDQEIADALQTSLHKVSYHIQILERIFNVQNRAQLAYLAARRVTV